MTSARPDTRRTQPTNIATPCANEILEQLERILSSPEFSLPERGHKFLRYVVEETLAGEADRIKGYSVALQVFGRATSFDAQSDPVVRIEAGRLRRALERYYLLAGQRDPIRIDIPKGAYVPIFTRTASTAPAQAKVEEPLTLPPVLPPLDPARDPSRWRTRLFFGAGSAALVSLVLLGASLLWTAGPNNAASPSAPERPKLLVLPFRDTSETAQGKIYAAGFTEEIINRLSAFKELTVLNHETSRSAGNEPDLGRLRDHLGARYIVRGSIRISGDQTRVMAQALETKTQAVLWSRTFSNDPPTRDLIKMQDEVARQVAVAVGQPYGVVFQADSRRAEQDEPGDLKAYFCTLRFYGYRAELNSAQHAGVRDCLERAVARWPNFATAWAMLSHIYLDEDRFRYNAKPGSPALPRAIDAARKAISLESDNVRALQSLMLALFFDGRAKEALSIGERAFSLNPNDPEFLGEFGSRVAQAGDWRRGSELLEEALMLNPGNSDYYRGMLALSAYMLGDHERAAREIRRARIQKFPLFYIVAAVIYAENGLAAEAAQAREEFLRLRPNHFEQWDVELAKRNYRPEDQAVMIEGARKAGFPVPARMLKSRD
jgi:adenylate cyclase